MIILKAYAKINLGLEILYKRGDGYHELNTMFLRTCLADDLLFEQDDDITVSSFPDMGIPQEDNLVYKATILLKENFPDTPGCKIHLKKNIPSGAGLGGGSSDAAITLKGLAALWNIVPNSSMLHDIASRLGSDVPFFLSDGAAIARGRGEKLKHFEFTSPWWIALIKPNISISTAWAYQHLDHDLVQRTPSDLKEIIKKSLLDPNILKKKVFNHFEGSILRKFPQIKYIKEKMYSEGAILSLLSGSGSTVFGLFESQVLCESAISHFDNYFTYICPPHK